MAEPFASMTSGIIFGAIILMLVWVGRLSSVVARVERKLDAVLRHSGIDLRRIAQEEAAALARAGKKIEAIKVYRQYTGCTLAEAKAEVESLPGSA